MENSWDDLQRAMKYVNSEQSFDWTDTVQTAEEDQSA